MQKKRIFFIRWFQRWTYRLVSEQDEREHWQRKNVKPCIFCERPVEIEHPFCSQCGGSQSAEAALQTAAQLEAARIRNTTGAQALVRTLSPYALPLNQVPTNVLPKPRKQHLLTNQIEAAHIPGEKHGQMKAYNRLREQGKV